MVAVIEKTSDLLTLVRHNKQKGNTVGFVPTMGALHKGHITLVKKSVKENDLTIVSIFINPTQFNDKKDLDKYPRTLEADLEKLIPTGVDVVFVPSEIEMYPDGDEKGSDIDLGGLDKNMEGAFRPGHFSGVAQVVKRLLDIVTPDNMYMGQKDFQQFTIIQYMIDSLKIKTKLVICPIIREPNGLAMSSRNERLSATTREKAGIIYTTLKAIKKYQSTKTVTELEQYGKQKLSVAPFECEYFSIIDGHKLTTIKDINDTDYVVVCVAVWADGVRLIDNIILKK
jgi:pantoate--beta-alanine ligase